MRGPPTLGANQLMRGIEQSFKLAPSPCAYFLGPTSTPISPFVDLPPTRVPPSIGHAFREVPRMSDDAISTLRRRLVQAESTYVTGQIYGESGGRGQP
jgi:hypothetical protein